MDRAGRCLVLFAILWIAASVTTAQIVDSDLMQCRSGWTKIKERCYVAVSYTTSWSGSLEYCGLYGAWLAEPVGYQVNKEIGNLVSDTFTEYWIGYNRPADEPVHKGKWSSGGSAGIEMGIWAPEGLGTVGSDNCAYVDKTVGDNLWSMTSCSHLKASVCEANPCPTDTFMCWNGNCRAKTKLCDGVDNCGDGSDEMDCSDQCSYVYTYDPQTTSGSFELETLNGVYINSLTCSWLISVPPGKRMSVSFERFDTELDADFFGISDYGPTGTTSNDVVSFSGGLENVPFSTYVTSNNFFLARFTSDKETGGAGFKVAWRTESECTGFRVLSKKGLTPDSEITANKTLLSKQSLTDCLRECDRQTLCAGFSFSDSGRFCTYFSALPVIQDDTQFDIHLKNCRPSTTITASVPLQATQQTATHAWKELTTPLYPGIYVAMDTFYVITSPQRPIQIDFAHVDLCCSDYIDIRNGGSPDDERLYKLVPGGEPPLALLSSWHQVYIYMHLKRHFQCGGALLKFRYGCDVTLTKAHGWIQSPGFGTSRSYGLQSCAWKLSSGSTTESVSVTFEKFDLENQVDTVRISGSKGQQIGETGTATSYQGRTFSSDNFIQIAMASNSQDSKKGFLARFSKGCSPLESEAVAVTPNTTNYMDTVTMTCASGYSFDGSNEAQSSVTLNCAIGGVWDVSPIPTCSQGMCGSPPVVANGYIDESTGEKGGETTQYICENGFTRTGDARILCGSDDKWETPPTCTSPLCAALNTTLDSSNILAEYVINSVNDLKHGTVAKLSCQSENMEVHGSQYTQCLNGDWDYGAMKPFCQKKPCTVPDLPNTVLSPQSGEFFVDDDVIATCAVGFVNSNDMTSSVTFKCDDETPPKCRKQMCRMADLDANLAINHDKVLEFGDETTVTCKSEFKIDGVATTHINITCLRGFQDQNGRWSYTPKCVPKTCGNPPIVVGSQYLYTACSSSPCPFNFTCKAPFTLSGQSSKTETIVSCGVVTPGLWDFGTLKCSGGECPDPGYLASGSMIGTSYTLGSTVQFKCDRDGHVVSPTDTITCKYNAFTSFRWSPELSSLSCKDTGKPKIISCPISVPTKMLTPTYFDAVSAEDPTGIEFWTSSPKQVFSDQVWTSATRVTYTFIDYARNSNTCSFAITIPEPLICNNGQTTITLTGLPRTLNISKMVGSNAPVKFFKNQVEVVNTNITVQSAADMSKELVFRVESNSHECYLLFTFKPKAGCNVWSLYVPNGTVQLSGNLVTVKCDTGFYFTQDPSLASKPINCVNNQYTALPLCGPRASVTMIKRTATVNIQYLLASPSSNTDCIAAYTSTATDQMTTVNNLFTKLCNPHSVAVLYGDIEMVQLSGDKVIVDATLTLNPTSSQGNIDTCITAISNQGPATSFQEFPATQGCPAATYNKTTRGSESKGCFGHRIHATNNSGAEMCIDCPLGYKFDTTTDPDSCTPCPEKTYGYLNNIQDGGASCVSCPLPTLSRKTGMKSSSECEVPARCMPGYFSPSGLEPCTACPKNHTQSSASSRTCSPCSDTGSITELVGSSSKSDCLSAAASKSRVCQPNKVPECKNGGTCTVEKHIYFCTCPNGWTGRKCETPVTSCDSNPCQNGRSCTPTDTSPYFYSCACPLTVAEESLTTRFWGQNCTNKKDMCPSNVCNNGGVCRDLASSYKCICSPNTGYTDSNCNIPRDPCTENPCSSNTIECIRHSTVHRQCLCANGYTGSDCENKIDTCSPNPCKNSGTCTSAVDDVTCTCQQGYTGKYCEKEKSCGHSCTTANPRISCEVCDTAGTYECYDVSNSFKCLCNVGYRGAECKYSTLPCASNPCKHGGVCTNVGTTGYSCKCTDHWTGTNCEAMVDRCTNVCGEESTCYSTTTSYRCLCPATKRGTNCKDSYEVCDRTRPCQGTGSVCVASATSWDFSCTCAEGLAGDRCQVAVVGCSDDYCQHGGICKENGNDLTCTCTPGYIGSRCETNINECASSPCKTNQKCIDIVNGYRCECKDGYRGASCTKPVTGPEAAFDYIITPARGCLDSGLVASFGDGETMMTSFSMSMWFRFIRYHDPGRFLTLRAYNDPLATSAPAFLLTGSTQGFQLELNTEGARRRKRAVSRVTLSFAPINTSDGRWHNVLLTWTKTKGEVTLYIDGVYRQQELFATGSSLPSSGNLVFGDFTGQVGSFEGRTSRFFMVNSKLTDKDAVDINSMTFDPSQYEHVIDQEKTMMKKFTVDFNSDLSTRKCFPTDTKCTPLYTDDSYPKVTGCPTNDVVVSGAERVANPSFPTPKFSTTEILKSNMASDETPLSWGTYGASSAVYDTDGHAAVCTYRIHKSRASCTRPADPVAGSQDCVNSGGVTRCKITCSNGNQKPSGDFMTYYTCSAFSSWNQTDSILNFIYPACSVSQDLEYDYTLTMAVNLTGTATCNTNSALVVGFRTLLLNTINNLNSGWQSDVCDLSCLTSIDNSLSCSTDGTLAVQLTFPGVKSPLTSTDGSQSSTLETILMKTFGDDNSLLYTHTATEQMAKPVLPSIQIASSATCPSNSQASNGSCVTCGEGTQYSVKTKKCEPCPVGYYKDQVAGSCTACTSTTTETTGSTSSSYCRTSCFTGKRYNPAVQADSGCVSCPVGFYQNLRGQFYCKGCDVTLTTADTGSNKLSDCVLQSSITTAVPTAVDAGEAPVLQASTEQPLEVGVIIAIVLACLLVLLIIIVILVFCCCKGKLSKLFPCLAEKTQTVVPEEKEKYHVNKYGETNIRFASYRLQDVRDKKRPLDRQPIVEPPSDESSSIKSVPHYPVFMEKLDGNVKNQHSYVTRGHIRKSTLSRRYEDQEEYDEQSDDERRRRKSRKTKKRHHRRPAELPEPTGPLPKALAPLPNRLKSMPPSDINIRPLSALNQPRQQVAPAQYQEFLQASSSSRQRGHRADSPESYPAPQHRRQSPAPIGRRVDLPQFYNQHETVEHERLQMKRIQVESDEDLR